jgi:hypothetical protein
MNLVILINSTQMFFRNFGLRHVNAALGHFAVELARPNACQKIARIAVPLEWLRSRILPHVPKKSIEPQIQGPLEVCAAAVSFSRTTAIVVRAAVYSSTRQDAFLTTLSPLRFDSSG